MKRASSPSSRGFTIVELLIVIVVIAILAAVTVVAYTGIQGRARDSQRMADLQTIMKALELYKIQNGNYPGPVGTAGASGWETSVGTTPFLSALTSGSNSSISNVPVDPINAVTGSLGMGRSSDDHFYFYYRYSAGSSGCDAARGNFYVLGVTRLDGVAEGESAPDSPGFECPSRSWVTEGAWVVGRFVN